MRERYLTTGSFASLCRTTRETLFHYDRINLLKPRLVSEKGYRRYAAEQFFEFDMIQVLKEAGSSLEEIRGYMGNYEPGAFLAILEKKRERLEKERERLAGRIKGLARIEEATRAALAADFGAVSFASLPEERLLVTPVDEQPRTWGATAPHFRRHFDHCAEAGLKAVFPLGAIIAADDLLRSDFGEKWYFSTIDEGAAVDGPMTDCADGAMTGPATGSQASPQPGTDAALPAGTYMIKAAGLYAITLHKGSYESLYKAIPPLLEEVARHGYAPAGHAYIYDLLSYLASQNEENDVQRLDLPVRQAP